MSQQDGKTEGWLYLIRSNRFGLQYSRRRYFVLETNTLSCFKSVPISKNENPRTAVIDSCIRVTDNGRESIKRNVFFIFTLYNSSNHNDQIKLGARSSEEAANWIRSLMEAALKSRSIASSLQGQQNHVESGASFSKQRWQPFRFSHKRRSQTDSVDWTVFPPINSDPITSDVIAPSPWTIFGCQNGLRLFKEAKDGDMNMQRWNDPAIMAVGVVAASSEAIFRTIMSLGPSRSEWDFCFLKGHVIEHLDGHTDIIHKKLKGDWLPWGMRPRDLLLRRYWRREDDGTYVILYHSVFHENCRPQSGYVRACLKSGGYVITPINQGRQSVVRHMLAIDWKSWKSYLFPSSAKCVTVRMLGRVAALRELFKANQGNYPRPDFSSGELMREVSLHVDKEPTMENSVESMEESTKSEEPKEEPGTSRTVNSSGSFVELNDAGDEFFDVPEQSEFDHLENEWPSHDCINSQDLRQTKLSSAAGFVKRLHELAIQKRGYIDLQESPVGDIMPCAYGATLPRDATCNMLCSWTIAEPSTFLIRGETYLEDRHKIKANGTLMQLIAADWLKSDKREDDLAGRPSSIVQKYASQGGNEFFFIINIQVPGSTTYSLAFYYMMDVPLQNVPLFERFVNGDDAFRNSRFKLIPYISKGSWIVKQSVGKKACLVGQALEIHYFRGKNYLELGIDIGSSTVARGVVSLVLGYLNNLVIEMAFVIQGNSNEELPEFLLGTCRLNHLDASKAVPVH